MEQGHLRTFLGMLIGTFAGVSLTIAMIPFVFSSLGTEPFVFVKMRLQAYILPIVFFWGLCGGGVAWTGGTRAGVLILGAGGLLSGVALGFFALGGQVQAVAISALTGLVYGGLGGVLLGAVFPKIGPKTGPKTGPEAGGQGPR